MSHGIQLHVWGEHACFTRPEMKVERVSYDAMTPSAARGVLEAIYWKPQIRWQIDRLHVLQPIRFTSLRRNEVSHKINARAANSAMKKGSGTLGQVVEDERQQRHTTLLRDVGYVIDAHFDIVDGENNPGKHLDQFNRRARAGQCFHHPYLGCREFLADFALVEPGKPDGYSMPDRHPEAPTDVDLGYMLYEVDFDDDRTARFFRARIDADGVIDVAGARREGLIG